MLGRALLAGILLAVLTSLALGPSGAYSQWQWNSTTAYDTCVDAGRPLSTDGWGDRYPWVDHPVLAELGGRVMVQHLFPRDDATEWQVGFRDGTTTISGEARGGEPLDLSMLDGIVADLGLDPADVVLWSDEPAVFTVGRTEWRDGEMVQTEGEELRERREYRIPSYPDLEAILEQDASDPLVSEHPGSHAGVSVWAGPWVWYVTAPDCVALEEDSVRVTVGPDGHGSLSGERLDRREALQTIRAAFGGTVHVGGLSPPPGSMMVAAMVAPIAAAENNLLPDIREGEVAGDGPDSDPGPMQVVLAYTSEGEFVVLRGLDLLSLTGVWSLEIVLENGVQPVESFDLQLTLTDGTHHAVEVPRSSLSADSRLYVVGELPGLVKEVFLSAPE